MKVNLNKDLLIGIDGAFRSLKEDYHSVAPKTTIKEILEKMFPGNKFDITITVVGDKDEKEPEFFVMAVYPEISTIDKMISAVASSENTKAIQKLWETNKVWYIEIDSKVLKDGYFDASEKELTAMLLHEIGHIVCTNSIPNRVSLILRYEIARAGIEKRSLLKGKVFRTIMSLPVLDSCISDNKKSHSSIKEEIKADNFVKKAGYDKELLSVLTKLSKSDKLKKGSIDDKMSKGSEFMMSTLGDIQARRDNLAKSKLLRIRENCDSEYISNILDESISNIFEDGDSFYEGKKLDYIHEKADELVEGEIFNEFFIFKHKLKRVEPSDIDYIAVKIQEIKNESDKMMIIQYIHSKMDMVNYYLDIYENPKMNKKYNIPNSYNELKDMQSTLSELRLKAINFKIPERNKNILIQWPSDYEG